MSVERPEDRQGERDSQLSAMFDGELPAGECELLARRLARDESLRAQWSRYSLIGAALRAERGVALHDRVAQRVQSVVTREAAYGDAGAVDTVGTGVAAAARAVSPQNWRRVGGPLAGAGIAASVAVLSIFWLRGAQEPGFESVADTVAPATIVLMPEPAVQPVPEVTSPAGESALYSTPAPGSATNRALPGRLANYVVAHSEYSGPLTRRMALLGIVGAESGEGAIAADAPAQGVPAPEDVDER